MTTFVAMLLTIAVASGFACLVTGAFFSRENLWLPATGMGASVLALVLSPNLALEILAVLIMVVCTFLTAATWAAGEGS